MKINRSLIMFALPVALAVVPASAQGEPVIAEAGKPKPVAKTTFKVESPTMARSIRDWHPEPGGKTTAAQAPTTAKDGESTMPPATEMAESAATRGVPPTPVGKRSEPAQEVPLKSIPR